MNKDTGGPNTLCAIMLQSYRNEQVHTHTNHYSSERYLIEKILWNSHWLIRRPCYNKQGEREILERSYIQQQQQQQKEQDLQCMDCVAC